MGLFPSSPLRRAINTGKEEKLRRLLDAAGPAAPDLINEDASADCACNPLFRNQRPPLQSAIVSGHVGCAEILVSRGADVTAEGYFRDTALHLAVQYGHTDLARSLLAAGADVSATNATGKTPVHTATHPQHGAGKRGALTVDLLRLLLEEHGGRKDMTDNGGNTPLHYAAMAGNVHAIEYLLSKGVDPRALKNKDEKTPIDVAANDNVRQVLSSAVFDYGIVLTEEAVP